MKKLCFAKLRKKIEVDMNIVVVEDDALIALFIKESVEELGHCVVGLFDEAAAVIAFVKETKPDLVLMDIEIKGSVDGIACAAALQNRYGVPSIFVTSHKESAVINDAMDVAPLGFLIKPIEESDLEAGLALAARALRHVKPLQKNVVGAYEFSFEYNTLKKDDVVVKLGKNELKLVAILFKNLNNTVSAEEIMRHIWGSILESDESLRQLIYRTRKKVPGLEINSSSKIGYSIGT